MRSVETASGIAHRISPVPSHPGFFFAEPARKFHAGRGGEKRKAKQQRSRRTSLAKIGQLELMMFSRYRATTHTQTNRLDDDDKVCLVGATSIISSRLQSYRKDFELALMTLALYFCFAYLHNFPCPIDLPDGYSIEVALARERLQIISFRWQSSD